MLASAHKVELLKPTAEHNTRRYDEEEGHYVGESFDRGERIIMVDGVRWGRTHVNFHGCYGTSHTFQQEGGHILEEARGKYSHDISVSSMRKRYRITDEEKAAWKPTEELVLAKAQELVASGQLRHPDIVRAERDEANERYRANCEAAEIERKAEFRRRASEALGMNQDDGSEIIDRVVAAMQWSQTK